MGLVGWLIVPFVCSSQGLTVEHSGGHGPRFLKVEQLGGGRGGDRLASNDRPRDAGRGGGPSFYLQRLALGDRLTLRDRECARDRTKDPRLPGQHRTRRHFDRISSKYAPSARFQTSVAGLLALCVRSRLSASSMSKALSWYCIGNVLVYEWYWAGAGA